MEGLTNKEISIYLQSGELTTPFLSNEYVLNKVMTDYNNKIKQNLEANVIKSLYNWIAHNVKYIEDKQLRAKLKFQRTAQEIWQSKTVTGCTDYAILFATFARQINIPTTFLHTAELSWVNRLISNEDFKMHSGHSFCECFVNNKWILVDPTFRQIEENYNSEIINLSYKVNESVTFLPYFRGLDLGEKQTIEEHNKQMDRICFNLFQEKLNNK